MKNSKKEEETRLAIRRTWIHSLFSFAHLEFQRGLWIGGRYPDLVGDFEEELCVYYDDLCLDEGYDHLLEQRVVSKDEFIAVLPFHLALGKYESNEEKRAMWQGDILDDPDWHAVCKLAKDAWDVIKANPNSKTELEDMLGLEFNYLTM